MEIYSRCEGPKKTAAFPLTYSVFFIATVWAVSPGMFKMRSIESTKILPYFPFFYEIKKMVLAADRVSQDVGDIPEKVTPVILMPHSGI